MQRDMGIRCWYESGNTNTGPQDEPNSVEPTGGVSRISQRRGSRRVSLMTSA